MASSRAYSTNYSDHIGLVHNFARKGWGRMIAAHVNVEYEDVLQEMSVTFTKAAHSYNPEKGIAFSSYVGRAIWNEFNRYAQKHIDERMELGLTSIEEQDARSEEDGGSWFSDSIESPDRTPEENLDRKQQMLANLRALSPTAKFLAAQLMSPPEALEEAFEEHRRAVSKNGGRAPASMSLRYIGQHYQIEPGRLTRAIKELKTQYGV